MLGFERFSHPFRLIELLSRRSFRSKKRLFALLLNPGERQRLERCVGIGLGLLDVFLAEAVAGEPVLGFEVPEFRFCPLLLNAEEFGIEFPEELALPYAVAFFLEQRPDAARGLKGEAHFANIDASPGLIGLREALLLPRFETPDSSPDNAEHHGKPKNFFDFHSSLEIELTGQFNYRAYNQNKSRGPKHYVSVHAAFLDVREASDYFFAAFLPSSASFASGAAAPSSGITFFPGWRRR